MFHYDDDDFSWKGLVAEGEEKACVVECKAYQEATTPYAVRNLLLHMHREKKYLVMDPPLNNQMRFGYYTSAHLFIGKTIKQYLLVESYNFCNFCEYFNILSSSSILRKSKLVSMCENLKS